MSAIYSATLNADGPKKLFKAGSEPDKLFLVNGFLSASSVRVAFSGGFEQQVINVPGVWFEFIIEPENELWVQGTGDYTFIVARHPIVWLMMTAQNLVNPPEKGAWCNPVPAVGR